MPRIAKREPGSGGENVGANGGIRTVKRELARRNRAEEGEDESTPQDNADRRVLRSRYLAMKNLISERRDELSGVDSDKFNSIMSEVEGLHQLVRKPREQVADAEALLDISSTLVSSVKSLTNEGITPSDFITYLLRDFGENRGGRADEENTSICWKGIGLSASHIFMEGQGCCTMLGPMNTEIKQRKLVARRRVEKPSESARPQVLENNGKEEKTDTDKNMATMFGILKGKKRVRLENMILNRKSFGQTVENLFALSFLVKDGRAEIIVNDKGHHFISPRNAPAASSVMSGEVAYNHFVFRYDFKDWKLMMESVGEGEELMPHREPKPLNASVGFQEGTVPNDSQATPIRKLTRNRGLIIQEEAMVEDSPEIDHDEAGGAEPSGIRRCKRKLQ